VIGDSGEAIKRLAHGISGSARGESENRMGDTVTAENLERDKFINDLAFKNAHLGEQLDKAVAILHDVADTKTDDPSLSSKRDRLAALATAFLHELQESKEPGTETTWVVTAYDAYGNADFTDVYKSLDEACKAASATTLSAERRVTRSKLRSDGR
jgi:hypothetical protein